MKINLISKIALIIFLSLGLAGCTFIFQKGRRSDLEKIEQLSQQLNELNVTKKILQDRLSQEIDDKQVRLEMMEKGLVVTFVADVLFDSGKARIKSEAYPILDKVAAVLKENVPDLNIGIEGHTDSVPIKLSGWKSNWELSTARALSVLHYLTDQKDIQPKRISAIGYGEYRPISLNDTKEGRQMNRRVEVVILPEVTKVRQLKSVRKKSSPEDLQEENLK